MSVAMYAVGTHAVAMPGTPFAPAGPVDPEVDLSEPGLEFTLPRRRLHCVLSTRVLHFTLVNDDA